MATITLSVAASMKTSSTLPVNEASGPALICTVSPTLYSVIAMKPSRSDERGEDLVREQRARGRQAQHVVFNLYQSGLVEAREVFGEVCAHVALEARAVLREVDAATQEAQAEEERFGARVPLVQLVARGDGVFLRLD